MGTPKPGVLLPDGRPMMAHVLETLGAVCHQVAVSGHTAHHAEDHPLPPSLIRIPDLRPGQGPLAALEAILASRLDSRYLVVSCDQPLLTAALLYRLASQTPASETGIPGFFCAINQAGKRLLDPFPGIYPDHLLGDVQRALDAGHRSIRDCIRPWESHAVPVSSDEEQQLKSMNTPADIEALFRAQGSR